MLQFTGYKTSISHVRQYCTITYDAFHPETINHLQYFRPDVKNEVFRHM